MSSTTWTPHAVASNAAAVSTRLWRAVEARHVASTRRLVDDLAEQRELEEILEATKPALPAAATRLHYLLATPFRYPAPRGSRFRAPHEPGLFYGADKPRYSLRRARLLAVAISDRQHRPHHPRTFAPIRIRGGGQNARCQSRASAVRAQQDAVAGPPRLHGHPALRQHGTGRRHRNDSLSLPCATRTPASAVRCCVQTRSEKMNPPPVRRPGC